MKGKLIEKHNCPNCSGNETIEVGVNSNGRNRRHTVQPCTKCKKALKIEDLKDTKQKSIFTYENGQSKVIWDKNDRFST